MWTSKALRHPPGTTPGSGKWTDAEKKMFEQGVGLKGWGRWIEVSAIVETRTSVQVKTHAQKVSVAVDLDDVRALDLSHNSHDI